VLRVSQTLEKARACLDTYTKLLNNRMFFYHEKCVLFFLSSHSHVTLPRRPSTLDIIVAAHTLLLLKPPLPDPILKDLIIESYPSLAIHARLVLSQAFPDPNLSPLIYHKPSTNTWSALIPTFGSNSPKPEPSDLEKEFTKMRWAWIGLAIVSTIGYLWMNPLVVVVSVVVKRRTRKSWKKVKKWTKNRC
jgi:sorting and assembly machinery component 37